MMTATNKQSINGHLIRAAMLCLLAVGAVLFPASQAHAQWATSGTTTSTNNNVGIGTSTPTDKLEINGNVANGATLTVTTSGTAKYRTGTLGTVVPNWGGQFMNIKFNEAASNWTLDDTTLNAGFLKLDLRNMPNGNEIGFYRMAAGPNPRPDSAWTPMAQFKLDTGNILLAPSSGSVGIGTTSPGILNGLSFTGYVPLHIQGAAGRFVVIDSATSNSGIALNDSSQPTDNRIWTMSQAAGSGKLTFAAVTDAGANSNKMVIDRAGNVGIGTSTPTAKLEVAGDINVAGNINAKYQDVAEWVPSTQKLAAGTVVVLDPSESNHVLASSKPYDTGVAGVISPQPGITLGERGEGKALVATTGRVKVKVDATTAPIRVGDLLVTSERSGYAMKSEPVMMGKRAFHSPGTIVGKALEPLEKGTGEILVLLSLQ